MIVPTLTALKMLPQSLDGDELLDVASRRLALNDFGDDHFLEPFHKLTQDLDNNDDIMPVGRFFYRKYLLNFLKNRLLLVDEWKKHPEVLDTPVKTPLIIVGLPRTGTTRLFNILERDENHRTLSFWEANRPAPPPSEARYKKDWRRKVGWLFIRIAYFLAPNLPIIHELRLDGPEECIHLLCNSFTSWLFAFQYDAPGYQEWFASCNHDKAYEEHKKQLQVLQSNFFRERWLLKSPAHLMGLDSLLKVYPDACIIHTHRDPQKVVPSACSLAEATRGIVAKQMDLHGLGAQVVEQLAPPLEHAAELRNTYPDNFIDIQYTDIVSDPMNVVEKIYDRFGFTISDASRKAMLAEVHDSPQHQRGRHSYTLEKYGLTQEIIETRFSAYRDAFHVPRESTS